MVRVIVDASSQNGLWALVRQPMKNFQEIMGKRGILKVRPEVLQSSNSNSSCDINCLHFHALTRKPGDFQVIGTSSLSFTRKVRYYSNLTLRKL